MGSTDDAAGSCDSEKITDEAGYNFISHLIDDAILGLSFEIHRSLKAGVFPDEPKPGEEACKIVIKEGYDIFGNQLNTQCYSQCKCPLCSQTFRCSRFAHHFENHKLGRRNANSTTYKNTDNGDFDSEEIQDGDDDTTSYSKDDDCEWRSGGRRPQKKKSGKAGRGKKKAGSRQKK